MLGSGVARVPVGGLGAYPPLESRDALGDDDPAARAQARRDRRDLRRSRRGRHRVHDARGHARRAARRCSPRPKTSRARSSSRSARGRRVLNAVPWQTRSSRSAERFRGSPTRARAESRAGRHPDVTPSLAAAQPAGEPHGTAAALPPAGGDASAAPTPAETAPPAEPTPQAEAETLTDETPDPAANAC